MADLGENDWLAVGEASHFLGESEYVVRELERSGRVRTKMAPGKVRGRLYSMEDLASVREATNNPIPLERDDQIDTFGHVPDWTHQQFFDRVRSCWMFLMSHGYLRKSESDEVLRRIEADIQGATLRVEKYGVFEVRTGRGVSEIWAPCKQGGMTLNARYFMEDHYEWAVASARTNFHFDDSEADPDSREAVLRPCLEPGKDSR